ncbi:MATE family efflux transporter [Helicobacter muridarum]|uniref:Multidrug-efflux transporter n=1 Tax=Helicobacter muridarum TaxID=216 RepID=A0A099U1C2_9HELI|nr:MATE family efflux transporter [Helicobacter muridarum]TLE01097.1 MATE family efflux transporter [Helicobacter muridarum]STQ85960.1 Na+ driven multidrug efflux pump [Helicobacter muridarum]
MSTTRAKIANILNIAIPSALQSGLDMLNLFIALFFLSNISPLYFTALSLGANYIIIFYPVSAIFGIGANVLMSRRYGAKNYTEMNEVCSTMLYSALIFCIPLLLVSYIGIPLYLQALDLSYELYSLSYSYVLITIFAIPAIMVKNIIISAFAATGDTKPPFYIKIVMTCLSIIGNSILINGAFGIDSMGLFGAAAISVFISYLELLALFLLIKFSKTRLELLLVFRWIFLKNGLKVAIPTGLERIFTIISLNVILIFVGKYAEIYGDSAINGFQAGAKIESFAFVPGFSFMLAIMSLMGQCIGVKDYKLAFEYTKLCAILSSIILGLCGILLAVFARPLSLIFMSKDLIAVDISAMYLIIIGLSQIPLILSFVYDGALRGAGWTQIPLFVNIISISLFRLLPMLIATSQDWHLYSLFVIIFIETYIRAAIFYIIFRSGVWQKKRNL